MPSAASLQHSGCDVTRQQIPRELRDNYYGSSHHKLEFIMAQRIGSFIARVGRNESFRKGIAAAGAGVLVATIVEIVWPSE